MCKFEESNFYKALQDFFINADKKTFLQFLAEFYNRTEGIIDKNNIQDDLLKELRELYLEFNEKGIDENIVRQKVNYFLENSVKIQNIISKLNTNTNKIEDVNTKLNANTNNIENITSQLDNTIRKGEGGSVTWAMASQDFRENITGGNTAVVGRDSILEENIVDGQVTEVKTSFISKSKNLLDERKLKPSTYINANDGTEISMTSYMASDYIEITPNTDYVFSNNDSSQVRSVAYYDADKKYVIGGERVTIIRATRDNIRYVRVSIATGAKNNQLEKGTEATNYEPYEDSVIKANISANNIIGKIPLEKINVDDILKLFRSRLYGKKIAFLGDSISDERSSLAPQIEKYYYRYIQENTGCEIYMHGCAGTGFNYRHEGKQDSINDRVTDIPNDADFIVVFAGTNDWGNNNGTILGDMEDYLNNRDNPYSSLYSAIGNTIEKLVSKFPFGKIAFITPLPRWDKGADMLHGANSRGFTLRQVAKAIIEICEWWSIPVLDLNANSNICTNGTLATGPVYYLDGLHPNTKGNKEILAPKIQTFLETL